MARRGTQLRAAMQTFVRRSCSAALVLLSWSVSRASTEGSVAAPTDDPVASLYPPSSGSTRTPPNLDASWFPWSNVVTISSVAEDPGRAYAAAAAAVLKANAAGGVVYFPPGTYTMTSSLQLVDGLLADEWCN